MKYAKILGLLAVAAAAMMAFAASASADTVTRNGDDTPAIHAISEEDAVAGTKHVLLHNPIANIPCESTAAGIVETHNSNHVAGAISALTFGPCTNGWVVHVNNPGKLTIEALNGTEGTLFSTEATVTATRFGLSCRYLTNNTHIGTVKEGNPATLDISASIPFHTGSPLCGTSASAWTGSYVTTHPLEIDE
jgi:hypothetical protein